MPTSTDACLQLYAYVKLFDEIANGSNASLSAKSSLPIQHRWTLVMLWSTVRGILFTMFLLEAGQSKSNEGEWGPHDLQYE